MWIESLQVKQFRNYDTLSAALVPHKNIFVGKNAAGKTNILEAIYYLSHGRSNRTRHERELIQWEQPFATVKLQAHPHRYDGDMQLEAQLLLTTDNRLQTRFKLNGHPVKSRSEIVGKIPTVTFFLSDLLMLRGTPEDRRTAIDSCLVQYDPSHFKRIAAYQRVRQQKSGLLKQPPHTIDHTLLDSIDQQLAIIGAELMMARIHYLQLAEALASVRYYEIAQGQDSLTIQYHSAIEDTHAMTQETLAAALISRITERRLDEIRRAQVLVGPHRDDIRFYLDQKDACLFGSQGQQRSIVLAMKLAEIELLKQKRDGEIPVLLLDDVMAELDPSRQHQLLAHLDHEMQVLLTTTHLDSELELFLNGSESIQVFEVSQGHIHHDTGLTQGAADVYQTF